MTMDIRPTPPQGRERQTIPAKFSNIRVVSFGIALTLFTFLVPSRGTPQVITGVIPNSNSHVIISNPVIPPNHFDDYCYFNSGVYSVGALFCAKPQTTLVCKAKEAQSGKAAAWDSSADPNCPHVR